MPWDPDADFQVTEADMFFLASYYNMTTYRRWSDMFPEGREYLLEINPHFAHRDPDDQLNVIDARWIDMTTGLFVDITAARYALDHPKGKGVLFDKNGHEFRVGACYSSTFNVYLHIPGYVSVPPATNDF